MPRDVGYKREIADGGESYESSMVMPGVTAPAQGTGALAQDQVGTAGPSRAWLGSVHDLESLFGPSAEQGSPGSFSPMGVIDTAGLLQPVSTGMLSGGFASGLAWPQSYPGDRSAY